MAPRATMKDVIKPMVSSINSLPVKVPAVFIRSRPVAASIVGMARRKENSTMVARLMPSDNPPIMVAAERETPGIMESDWYKPIIKACL